MTATETEETMNIASVRIHVERAIGCIKTYHILDGTLPNTIRLLQTFTGVLGEKIRLHAILKENMANCISLESLINVDFRKKL